MIPLFRGIFFVKTVDKQIMKIFILASLIAVELHCLKISCSFDRSKKIQFNFNRDMFYELFKFILHAKLSQ